MWREVVVTESLFGATEENQEILIEEIHLGAC
jgi:hypothetical protein